MKYLSIILLILCFACNDGGSDPEIVKAETDLVNAKRGLDLKKQDSALWKECDKRIKQ